MEVTSDTIESFQAVENGVVDSNSLPFVALDCDNKPVDELTALF